MRTTCPKGLEQVGQEGNQRAPRKEGRHDEDQGQHGAVPEGTVVQNGEDSAVGPEEDDADGQTEEREEPGTAMVPATVLGGVGGFAESQPAVEGLSRPVRVLRIENQLLS